MACYTLCNTCVRFNILFAEMFSLDFGPALLAASFQQFLFSFELGEELFLAEHLYIAT